jgi:hypothetical protein
VRPATACPTIQQRTPRQPTLSTQLFFAFAHLAFWAAAILARPSALIFLPPGFDTAVSFELTGRPRLGRAPIWSFNRVRAFSSRAISASIVWII